MTFKKQLSLIAATASMSLMAFGAQAESGYYGMPAPVNVYVDIKAGQNDFSNSCGVLYSCDRSTTSYGLTYGVQMNPNYAVEIGYTDFGQAKRGGGDTKAQAANLSFVGRIPLNQFALFAKVGMSYGKTETTTALISDVRRGNGYGWAPSYGVGVSYDLTSNVAVLAEWAQTNMAFAGEGQEHVDGANIGLRLKF